MALNLFGALTKENIKVAYIDPILGLVEGISISEANEYAKREPETNFIFKNGNQLIQYLNINQVNNLNLNILIPTNPCNGPTKQSATVGGTPVTAGGTGGTSVDTGGIGGIGGTSVDTGGTGGTGGTPVTAGGIGGTPVTAGGIPITAGGIGGTPVTAGGTGGTSVTAGGTTVNVGGTPVTAGGTGGTPVTAGGIPITAGGTGGTPVTAGGTGGIPITAEATGGVTGGTKEIGPPTIKFFGGNGIGAAGNPIIGTDGSLLAVDIVNGGYGYQYPPLVSVKDVGNNGAGATLIPVLSENIINENTPSIIINELITLDSGQVVPREVSGRGVVVEVIVTDPGNGYLSPTPPIQVLPTPINIPSGAPTGINASFRPQFEVVRDPVVVNPQKLLQVTDLVGLKQTGYVNGRAYYGSVYYDKGIRYAGFYETIGEPIQVYDTLRESIIAQVITPPSAILRQGTDIRSNNPLLNIPGTVQSTLSSNSIIGAGDYFPPSVPFVQEPVKDSIYPVSLRLKRVIVEDPGINYNITDQIRVIPSNGAVLEPVFGSFGRVIKVAVIDPGFGFTEYPRIEMFTPL